VCASRAPPPRGRDPATWWSLPQERVEGHASQARSSCPSAPRVAAAAASPSSRRRGLAPRCAAATCSYVAAGLSVFLRSAEPVRASTRKSGSGRRARCPSQCEGGAQIRGRLLCMRRPQRSGRLPPTVCPTRSRRRAPPPSRRLPSLAGLTYVEPIGIAGMIAALLPARVTHAVRVGHVGAAGSRADGRGGYERDLPRRGTWRRGAHRVGS